MTAICLYFQVHQPYRIRQYSFFNIGKDNDYFDDDLNIEILNRVADHCYLPTNALLLRHIITYKKHFKIAFGISGIALEQFERHRPDVLASFVKLAKTGCVEFLSETYYHSLSSEYSLEECTRQVEMHREKILEYFGQIPKVIRNTECIYSNAFGDFAQQMGYKGVLAEGVPHILHGRSPNFLYSNPITSKIKILLRNYNLSDDISFRFSDSSWAEYPLTAEKYAIWLSNAQRTADVINLFMDYETFGEHQWRESGIFEFLEHLPQEILKTGNFKFSTPSEVIENYPTRGIYDANYTTSWADNEKDFSAWASNNMQLECLNKLYQLREPIMNLKNKKMIQQWSYLLASDHFYYMSTKNFADGSVHQYFSPFSSPYDAYIYFINVLSDLEIRINKELKGKN